MISREGISARKGPRSEGEESKGISQESVSGGGGGIEGISAGRGLRSDGEGSEGSSQEGASSGGGRTGGAEGGGKEGGGKEGEVGSGRVKEIDSTVMEEEPEEERG